MQDLRKATSNGTKNSLKNLADPRVVNYLKEHQEENQEIHLLINTLIQRWTTSTNDSKEENPNRLSTLKLTKETASPNETIAQWKEEVEDHYDEIFDTNNKLRDAYHEIYPIIQKIEANEPERIDAYEKQSLKDFMKDNKLYHIPRMLTQSEHQKITSGVFQRAKAIQSFLQDYLTNGLNASCFTNDIIPQNTFKQILLRNHEQDFVSKFNVNLANNWGFWYGPDLIRGPTGEMYVCEDNIGFVSTLR